MSPASPEKSLRSDAARRRQAVLDAARVIFAEQGVDVPIEAIAQAAGVGRATVHRNFFDRKGLLLALLNEELDQFAEDVAAADLTQHPMALVDAFARLSLNNAALLPHWQAMNAHEADFAVVRRKFLTTVEAALPRAIASGQIRSDLTPSDLELIAGMLGAALRGDTAKARDDLTARALQLIKSGVVVRAGELD